ncbi:hypothetical protein EV126DRAFT_231600 [Verticillium dahliae]|nr:hypothetical protein EV126DRAFT_231600 [Verticillium dahliae]
MTTVIIVMLLQSTQVMAQVDRYTTVGSHQSGPSMTQQLSFPPSLSLRRACFRFKYSHSATSKTIVLFLQLATFVCHTHTYAYTGRKQSADPFLHSSQSVYGRHSDNCLGPLPLCLW